MLADILVPILAGMLSTSFIGLVCMTIAFVFSLGIKREYSANFWFRSVLLGQLLFWGALFLDMSATSYGYFRSLADVLPVIFNFFISFLGGALMIRTCLRFRKTRGSLAPENDPKDKLDGAFNALGKAKGAASKIVKVLPK